MSSNFHATAEWHAGAEAMRVACKARIDAGARKAEFSPDMRRLAEALVADITHLIDEMLVPAEPAVRDLGAVTSKAARDILTERRRQIEVENWTPEHDDAHSDGSLALAAACYAEGPSGRSRVAVIIDDVSGGRGEGPVWGKWGKRKKLVPLIWPWDARWWKPSPDRRRDLVRAAALLIAEIERMDRAAIKRGEA